MGLAGLGVGSLIANNIIATFVGFAVCASVYIWLAFLFGIIGAEEITYLPMKRVLRAVHRVVRFWEYKDES